MRAPEGERRSLESMVFEVYLPLVEGLVYVVMRSASCGGEVSTRIWDGFEGYQIDMILRAEYAMSSNV